MNHDHSQLPINRVPVIPQSLKDPVCGMAVTEQSAHQHLYDGTLFYFCSSACEKKFNAKREAVHEHRGESST